MTFYFYYFVDRTKTGIPGLDELLYGGIPKGNLVVLSGDPGSGKTCMCLQFLAEGAKTFNEPGVYISLEESEQELIELAKNFGWDFQKLIDSDKLRVESIELYDFERLKTMIEDTVKSIKAQRLVIDPGVIFRLFFERELDARKKIVSLGKMLKTIGCTTIITSERELDDSSGLFGLEEYVADGVILLFHTRVKGVFERSIGILKMRGTKVSEVVYPLQINADGTNVVKTSLFYEKLKAAQPDLNIEKEFERNGFEKVEETRKKRKTKVKTKKTRIKRKRK
ncbi:MAG: ATPase domain-containing protein [archaeon]